MSFRTQREILHMLSTNIIQIYPYGRNDKYWVSEFIAKLP